MDYADGIFLLSLISGRNPDLLIGQHVLSAPMLKKSKLEIISTGNPSYPPSVLPQEYICPSLLTAIV